jgi:hypothetical protein
MNTSFSLDGLTIEQIPDPPVTIFAYAGNDFLRPARAEAGRPVRRTGIRVAWGRADQAGERRVEEAAWIAGSTTKDCGGQVAA